LQAFKDFVRVAWVFSRKDSHAARPASRAFEKYFLVTKTFGELSRLLLVSRLENFHAGRGESLPAVKWRLNTGNIQNKKKGAVSIRGEISAEFT
jgi:hypothetical protein